MSCQLCVSGIWVIIDLLVAIGITLVYGELTAREAVRRALAGHGHQLTVVELRARLDATPEPRDDHR